MNTIWSNYIQSIGTLYASRSLRFSDYYKNKYQEIFEIEDCGKILEIGCGPGALAESLARWYPNTQLYGIDRDSNFIEFASKKNMHINFREGDATALAFEKESFEVTISNTVAEHIEPSKFYGEQYRVLKAGGVCIVLSVRKGLYVPAQCIREKSDFEKEIWERADRYFDEIHKKYDVCSYPQNESELPSSMEKYGFKNVTTDYVTVNLTPDNPRYSKEMAYAMINANRQNELDNVECLSRIAAEVVTPLEVEKMRFLVNERYDKRILLYDKGIKQWDTNVTVTMIVRGVK